MLPPPVPAARRRRRRRWVRVVAWIVTPLVILVAVFTGIGAVLYARADVSNVGDLSFENPLRIPDVLDGERGADGVVRYELEVESGTTSLRDGPETATWGVNGTYLGPTLRASRGDEVEIEITNGVDETTTVHWHGMHLPAPMDGGPHQPIAPGATWRPTWTVDQPAATLWYHPHPHGETAEHVYRGVAGLFILDDEESAGLDLPAAYGVDDVPLIIQDRDFDGDNQFRFSSRFLSNVGVLGDEILVNGTHDPHLDVTTERIRLRVVNASNARAYDLGFADGRTFQLVGTDGGLLPSPVDVTRMPLSPGERAEVVVTMQPGERQVLRSFPRGSGGGFFSDRFSGRDDTFDIIELRAAADLAPSPAVPEQLVDLERLDPADAVTTREFRLSGTSINGADMDMSRIDATIVSGSTEIWDVTNADGVAHNFHVHDVQFQVADIDGAPPPADLAGWKDTVEVRSGTTTRLVIRFGTHTDPDVPYMFHCHLLAHEDRGMMGQFVIVEAGESAGQPPMAGHDHD